MPPAARVIASSFTEPSLSALGIFFHGRALSDPVSLSAGGGGSSGMWPPYMLPASSSDFAGDGGGGMGRASKYGGSSDEVAFSGGSPGISRSNPALMNVTPCV